MKIDYYQLKRWGWLIIIFCLTCAWCTACKSTYHLKKAIEKDPTLSLTDTITEYKFLEGVGARVSYPLLTNAPYFEINNIEFRRVVEKDTIYYDVKCPPNEVVTKYVPKIRFVKEELSRKELIEKAKDLGQLDRLKISKSEVFGAFLFGAFCILAVLLYFKIFR